MATYGDNDSLTELERRAESSRADLIHTVDSLHSRVSPQAIKNELKGYARDTGQQFLHNMETRARENPLQTVAIAAGLAYPMWRVICNIPAPILLVGAGLAMARRNGGSGNGTQGHDAYNDAYNAVAAKAGSMADTAAAKASATADAVKEKAAEVVESTTSRLQSVGTQAADATAAASDSLSSAYRDGIDLATSATQQASESLNRGKDSVIELIERHPFIVGGVTFLIGGLVASALPVTRTENRVLGQSSDQLKDRALDIAAEGLDGAAVAAEEVYQATVLNVKEQGLTAEAARNAVRDVAGRVGSAVDKTAAALDTKQPKASARRVAR